MMNPDQLEKKFVRFRSAFIEMKKKSEGLATVNEDLRTEIVKLKGELANKEGQLEGFQNRSKIDKIVNELESEEGKKLELKGLLDQYIKELDDCIEMLRNS